MAVTVELDGLASNDGYQCQATVDLRVSVIPETGDIESFQRQVLGSHRVVQVEALGRYLEPGIHRGLSGLFATHDGKELAGSDKFYRYYGFYQEDMHFLDCVRSGETPETCIADAAKTFDLVDMLESNLI